MAEPLPQTPPSILPPIRTMADDLAAASRGQLSAELPSRLSSVGNAPTPVAPTLARIQPVALPSRPPKRARRRGISIFIILLVGAAAGFGIFGARLFIPKNSGTVADVVPAEAIAFISVHLGEPRTEEIALALSGNFQGLTPERLQGASDLTVLLFPGASPAEPIPALLVRGLPALDLSGAPALSPIPLPGGILVVETTHRGRLEALSGRTWGREAAYRSMVRELSDAPPVLMSLRGPVVEALLQPFSPHPVRAEALVLSLTPGEGDAPAVAQGSTARMARKKSGSGGSGDEVAGSTDESAGLPGDVIFAGVRPDLRADLTELPESGTLPDTLVQVLRVFRDGSDAARSVTETFAGPWTFGVLPTAQPGVRDAVAIIPLREGGDPSPALRTLEATFTEFGPYLTGSVFPEATFVETVYGGVTIRYVNFGSPARAFDYAVVGGKLLVATSRESMYALVDVLNTLGSALASRAEFARLAGATTGADWLYLRADDRLAIEHPGALAVFHRLLPAIVVKSVESGSLEGLAELGVPYDAHTAPQVGEGGLPLESPLPEGTPLGEDNGTLPPEEA